MTETPFFTALSVNNSIVKDGTLIYGYYVKCRGRHYLLQAYNYGGYDERWEAAEWIEIDIKTLSNFSFQEYLKL